MSNPMDAVKFDICCAARALFRAGLSAGIAGHLSVAVVRTDADESFRPVIRRLASHGHMHL